MSKQPADPRPILSNDHNPEKTLKAMGKFIRTMTIVSVILVIWGFLFSFLGFSLYGQLGPFAKDSEKFMSIAMISLGIIAILAGIIFPIAVKSIVKSSAKNQEIRIYSDHVEGRAIRISGSTQTLLEFYETFDKIDSVSTTETNVSINLKDGNAIRCIASNAQEIASFLRSRIS